MDPDVSDSWGLARAAPAGGTRLALDAQDESRKHGQVFLFRPSNARVASEVRPSRVSTPANAQAVSHLGRKERRESSTQGKARPLLLRPEAVRLSRETGAPD